jgi:cysteine synthase A
MAKIYENITDLIGNTPLVKLNKLTEGLPGTVAVKLESANPGNSVKDRIGAAIIDAAVDKANEIVENTENAVLARQFANPANPKAHYETTGPEIWADTDGKVDVFIAGIGTGGTVSGAGKYLKEQSSDVKIVGVEPKDSPLLTEGKFGPHKIQGIGTNFFPDNLDKDIIDEVYDATIEDSVKYAREIAAKEGILVGISTGANIWAAVEEAKKPENEGKLIVAVVADFGERYVSTLLFDDLRD